MIELMIQVFLEVRITSAGPGLLWNRNEPNTPIFFGEDVISIPFEIKLSVLHHHLSCPFHGVFAGLHPRFPRVETFKCASLH